MNTIILYKNNEFNELDELLRIAYKRIAAHSIIREIRKIRCSKKEMTFV